MTPHYRLLLLGLLLLALAGCATVGEREEEAYDPDDPDVADVEDAEDGADEARVIRREDCPPDCPFERGDIEAEDSLLAERVIYFEFDSSRIRSEFRDVLRRHAEYLTRYSDVDVRLEGHTDERGSREYNIGLGDRRAQSVRRLMEFQGVAPDQIRTVSYGEEKPAVEGHDEQAWSRNRRVEIVYMGQ